MFMADLIKKTKDRLVYFTSPQLMAFPALRHAFFSREGGVSEGEFSSLNFRFGVGDDEAKVIENYSIGGALLGARPENMACTMQRHTDNILVVKETGGLTQKLSQQPVDALITNVPGICLTGFYADCQLIMIYNNKRKVCAVVHCGWRGVANELLRKTIDRMCAEFDCRPMDMTVAVGPSICRRCFETDSDVPDILREVYGELIKEYIYKEDEKWHVDLKNITYSTLLRYGVLPFNIDVSNQCTSCSTDKIFWSHRRNGERRGVHAGMIMLV